MFNGSQRLSSFMYVSGTDEGVTPFTERDEELTNAATFKNSTDLLLTIKSAGSYVYDEEKHIQGAKRVLNFMYEAWVSNKLCDMVIHVPSSRLYCHKMVICAYSNAMEQECECFPKGNIVSLDLTDFSKEIVTEMLYFLYTTNIRLNDDNVRHLIRLAYELDIQVLLDICEDYLCNFDVSNALHYYILAEEMELPIADRILKFLCENFVEISKFDDFMELEIEQLIKIVSHDSLNVASELEVFLAIVRWINYDSTRRLPLAPSLLIHVRFYKISPEVLVTKVEIYTEIFNIYECHLMLYDAMKFHALSLSGSSLVDHLQFAGGRQTRGKSAPTVYLGQRTDSNRIVIQSKVAESNSRQQQPLMSTERREEYITVNPAPKQVINTKRQSGQWERLSNTLTQQGLYRNSNEVFVPNRQADSNTSNNHFRVSESIESMVRERPFFNNLVVVCVGGMDIHSSDMTYPGKCVYKYDEKMNQWSLLTMMQNYTHHHTAAAVAGKLYVIGGLVQNSDDPEEPSAATNVVRLFDTESNSWIQAARMLESRAYINAAVHKNSIYVAGGEDEHKIKLDTIERYDATFDRWTLVGRMRGGPKIGAATCVYKNCLYIVGGYNHDRTDGPVLTDVECYDLAKQRWVERKPLRIPRCHANLVVANDRLYMVGGRTQTNSGYQGETLTSLSSIAVYDDVNDFWFHVTDMATPRLDAGCTVIGNKIYIIGGMHTPNPSCLDLVECFDTVTKKWQNNVTSLPYPAAGLSCVTL